MCVLSVCCLIFQFVSAGGEMGPHLWPILWLRLYYLEKSEMCRHCYWISVACFIFCLGHLLVPDLRRRSTVARLLRSWVRIPAGTWMFVWCVCCQVGVSATSWSVVQRSITDCGASLCVIEKPRGRGGHNPRWAAEPEKKNRLFMVMLYKRH
jgi:hypothetical protein